MMSRGRGGEGRIECHGKEGQGFHEGQRYCNLEILG